MNPNSRSPERPSSRSESGFSLVEVLIAMAAFATALMPMLYVAGAGQRLARSQPEASDLQQRVRVAVDKMQRDLALAGAGPLHGPLAGRMSAYVPALVPARTGLRSPDAAVSVFDDRVSLLYVPEGAGSVALAKTMANVDADLSVDPASPGCSTSAAGLCGFTEGTRALIVDTARVGDGFELFTVTRVGADALGALSALKHDAPNPTFTRLYGAGAAIVPIVQRIYHFDRAGRRLMLYDGYQSDMPFIDHVVDVRFELFAVSSGSGLAPLSADELTDGPIVGVSPGEFDRDLLGVRMVRVTLRLEAAADDVRGIGPRFRRPGRSNSAFSEVPDHEITFDVALRNVGGAP
jgi:prepilin-type N-terminal cleavage/methylation domain-containing protein